MDDLYYNPEKFGYELVGELDEEDLCYEFHMLCVWKRVSDGRLFWAEDWGCSCPSPFECFTDPSGEWPDPIDSTRAAYLQAISGFPAKGVDKQRSGAEVEG